jgi:hypothetical protein
MRLQGMVLNLLRTKTKLNSVALVLNRGCAALKHPELLTNHHKVKSKFTVSLKLSRKELCSSAMQ